jgi:hypothetical protein
MSHADVVFVNYHQPAAQRGICGHGRFSIDPSPVSTSGLLSTFARSKHKSR